MDGNLRQRLEKILALTSSPNENEAALAMEKLQELLTKHNLDMADLETRGQKAPSITEKGHDLGKAAFTWKLNLASLIAEHYFCYPIVDKKSAVPVRFIGRPENVDALVALYRWIIDQIKTISRNERRIHIERTGEHIDPLRWQVNFGIGIVGRLGVRLEEIRRKRAEDNAVNALVIHHQSEISDWMEEQWGYRVDGQDSKFMKEYKERYRIKMEFKSQCEENGDMEPFYQQYPSERPLEGDALAEYEKSMEKMRKKWDADDRRRKAARERRANRPLSASEWTKMQQEYTALQQGKAAADQVNLTPFLKAGVKEEVLV